jgi:methyl-accepting chemotaxis protein
MEKAMERVGQGDFTAEMGYKSKDEIGLASIQFGVMTENIRRLIKGTVSSFASVTSASDNVMNNVEGLLSASREVTKAVEEIAEGAMETATGVNERLSAG